MLNCETVMSKKMLLLGKPKQSFFRCGDECSSFRLCLSCSSRPQCLAYWIFEVLEGYEDSFLCAMILMSFDCVKKMGKLLRKIVRYLRSNCPAPLMWTCVQVLVKDFPRIFTLQRKTEPMCVYLRICY